MHRGTQPPLQARAGGDLRPVTPTHATARSAPYARRSSDDVRPVDCGNLTPDSPSNANPASSQPRNRPSRQRGTLRIETLHQHVESRGRLPSPLQLDTPADLTVSVPLVLGDAKPDRSASTWQARAAARFSEPSRPFRHTTHSRSVASSSFLAADNCKLRSSVRAECPIERFSRQSCFPRNMAHSLLPRHSTQQLDKGL